MVLSWLKVRVEIWVVLEARESKARKLHLEPQKNTANPTSGRRYGVEKREPEPRAVPLEVMQALNLPPFEYKLTQSGESLLIWDVLRRKHVALTPEEWVRQHVIHFLITHRGYPRGLLCAERGHRYNQRQKRTDLCALGPAGEPLLLVECKAPSVPITAAVAQQAAVYNQTIGAPLLLLTNGLQHFCWRVDFTQRTNERLTEVPLFPGTAPV